MANYMEEVAKMLGVELGEKFRIVGGKKNTIAKLTNNGIIVNCEPNCISIMSNQVLGWLLTGKLTIERILCEFTYGQKYYSIGPGGVLEPGVWMDDFVDRALYKLGNCYRTYQEAEANKDKWIDFYSSDEILEV